jgi:hypothetical protein
MRSPMAVVLLGLALAPSVSLAGQWPDSVQPGTRVRVKRADLGAAWLQGQLVMLTSDSAAIARSESVDTVRFATDVPGRFEISQGIHARTGKGALLGLGIGFGAGLALGLAASAESCTGFCVIQVGPEEVIGVALFFGGVGAGIGALIGSVSHGERWKRLEAHPLGQARITPVVRGDRFGLALRL